MRSGAWKPLIPYECAGPSDSQLWAQPSPLGKISTSWELFAVAWGTLPPAAPAAPAVGGVVGHMLEHQRAVDLMVQGLTVPSTSAWNEGAATFASAPLRDKDLPRDPELTRACTIR